MSSSSGKALKLVDQFIYLVSNISSTESEVNISIVKVWIVIGRFQSYGNLIIWKYDFSNEI